MSAACLKPRLAPAPRRSRVILCLDLIGPLYDARMASHSIRSYLGTYSYQYQQQLCKVSMFSIYENDGGNVDERLPVARDLAPEFSFVDEGGYFVPGEDFENLDDSTRQSLFQRSNAVQRANEERKKEKDITRSPVRTSVREALRRPKKWFEMTEADKIITENNREWRERVAKRIISKTGGPRKGPPITTRKSRAKEAIPTRTVSLYSDGERDPEDIEASSILTEMYHRAFTLILSR